MKILDGKKIAADIKSELKLKVQKLREQNLKPPGLAAILVGDNPASQVYVKSKGKSCDEIGYNSRIETLSENISEVELLAVVKRYNEDENFHGILVQLPLPKQIDENKIINAISPQKDVDGFHPFNVGELVIGNETLYPCTPAGIQEILKRYDIETKGKHVVILGRSNIVGKPIANILLQKKKFANAVVTVCHSAAKDLKRFTLQADILIAALGSPNFVTADMIKDGAVVIDVGINRIPDENAPKGYKIVGDVLFDEVSKKSSFITPVPGGVGPMTIAMLLQNTFLAYSKIENYHE